MPSIHVHLSLYRLICKKKVCFIDTFCLSCRIQIELCHELHFNKFLNISIEGILKEFTLRDREKKFPPDPYFSSNVKKTIQMSCF